MLDYEEAGKDSPSFRAALGTAEGQLKAFYERVAALRSALAAAAEAEEKGLAATRELLVAVMRLVPRDSMGQEAEDDPDDVARDAVWKLVDPLNSIQEARRNLVGVYKTTLDAVSNIKTQEGTFGHKKDIMLTCRAEESKAQDEFVRLGRSADPGVVEVAEDKLKRAAQLHRDLRLDYSKSLNGFELSRHPAVIEQLLFMFQGLTSYHESARGALSESLGTMEEMAVQVATMQQQVDRLMLAQDALKKRVAVGDAQAGLDGVREGYVLRRSVSRLDRTLGEGWELVYLQLRNGLLTHQPSGSKLPRALRLRGKRGGGSLLANMLVCTAKAAGEDVERRSCFVVIGPRTQLLFQAIGDQDRDGWLQSLQASTGQCLSSMVLSTPSRGSHGGDDARQIGMLMAQLQMVEGNQLCADCQAFKPDWASISLGILLCIECSGAHRKMGVHFSKVRSLTLDSWTVSVLNMMVAVGNVTCNAAYEGGLPPDARPSSASTMDDREAWIACKYQRCTWLLPPEELGAVGGRSLDEALYECCRGKTSMLEVVGLLANGADPAWPNVQEQGQTALHAATHAQWAECVEYLLQNQANPHQPDATGLLPVELARDMACDDIVGCLEGHQAVYEPAPVRPRLPVGPPLTQSASAPAVPIPAHLHSGLLAPRRNSLRSPHRQGPGPGSPRETSPNTRGSGFVHSGYIKKQGRKVRGWKQRYLALGNGQLYLFKTQQDAVGAGSLPEKTARKIVAMGEVTFALLDPSKHTFSITTKKAKWLLAADSALDMTSWIAALTAQQSALTRGLAFERKSSSRPPSMSTM